MQFTPLSERIQPPWTASAASVAMADAGGPRVRPPVLVSKMHLEPGAAEAAAAAAARRVAAERLVTAPTAPAAVAPAPAGPASGAGAAAPPLPAGRGRAALAQEAPGPALAGGSAAGTAAGQAAAAVQSAVAAAGGDEPHSHGSWLQQLLDGVWRYARDAAQRMAWETIPPALDASRPPWVSVAKMLDTRLPSRLAIALNALRSSSIRDNVTF